MEDSNAKEIRELEAKILAKRQQVEFDKTNMALKTEYSPDNRQNPDVSEEFKNLYDPAGNVIEKGELKELSEAQEELIRLIDKLHKLKNNI
jgi:peptide subunit release factor 1 (eRF1)